MVPRVALVGIGGYGETLLGILRAAVAEGLCRLVAAVVRTPGKYPESETVLGDLGVRRYLTIDELLSSEDRKLELVVIAAGVSCHAYAAVMSLNAGFHVLCEKPVAGSLADARKMQAAAAKAGRMLAIGYQGIFSPTIDRLKKLKINGELGVLQNAKARIGLPRGARYYQRRDWGGQQKTSGVMVLDSPIQNATAHHLQNMLYLAGEKVDKSATPITVIAENYRAARGAWADTQYIQVETAESVRISMLSTHACLQSLNVRVEYQFDRATVIGLSDRTIIETSGGVTEEILEPREVASFPFRAVIKAMQTGDYPACSIDNALQHTACIEGSFAAAPPKTVPAEHVILATPSSSISSNASGPVTAIRGITALIQKAYKTATGYAGAGAKWAVSPSKVSLSDDLAVVYNGQ